MKLITGLIIGLLIGACATGYCIPRSLVIPAELIADYREDEGVVTVTLERPFVRAERFVVPRLVAVGMEVGYTEGGDIELRW